MRDHAIGGSLFNFTERKNHMDTRPMAMMLILVALATSEPAHLFRAALDALMIALQLISH